MMKIGCNPGVLRVAVVGKWSLAPIEMLFNYLFPANEAPKLGLQGFCC